jgi:hypothetical protein
MQTLQIRPVWRRGVDLVKRYRTTSAFITVMAVVTVVLEVAR